jgi:ADYC domain-containing protein
MATRGRFFHSDMLGGAIVIVALVLGMPCRAQDSALSIEVVGTTLRVRLPDGSVRAGRELVGGIVQVALGGVSLRVRIAGVEQDQRDREGEVVLYDFRVVAPDGREEPLCNPDPDGRRLGMPLAGRSDAAGILTPAGPGQFELVCTAGPQGKCLRFGYAPWRKAPDGRPLIDWFNSCVRMLRGDYCGDGRHFTRDGTWIDLYDRIGIQKSDEDPSLSFEAAWGPRGAICVARTRLPDLIDLDGLARACPRLAGRLGPAACADGEQDGLVMNRSR